MSNSITKSRIFFHCLILSIFSLSPYFTKAQSRLFTGRLIDSETLKSIANATVYIPSSDLKVYTNQGGYFQVEANEENIEFSHIGYHRTVFQTNFNKVNFVLSIKPMMYVLDPIQLEKSVTYFSYGYLNEVFDNEMIRRKNDSLHLEYPAFIPGGMDYFNDVLIGNIIADFGSFNRNINCEVHFTIQKDGKLVVDSIANGNESTTAIKEIYERTSNWVPSFQGKMPVLTHYSQPFIYSNKLKILTAEEVNPENQSKIDEVNPEYLGGMPEFYKMIFQNQVYPKDAKNRDIEGRVYVQFVVLENGQVEQLKVIKGIGYGCDEEAMRLVALSSGNWIPGKQYGNTVKVRMVLPIIFKL